MSKIHESTLIRDSRGFDPWLVPLARVFEEYTMSLLQPHIVVSGTFRGTYETPLTTRETT